MKLTCPDCGHASERAPKWVAETAFYRCPKCRVMIEQDPDQVVLARSLADLEAALDAVFGEFLKK